jgi:hypothetical protein
MQKGPDLRFNLLHTCLSFADDDVVADETCCRPYIRLTYKVLGLEWT